MPHITTDDGVKLYYEETGIGTPIVFVHELAGDCRSYEPQVRHFARTYRCITYNARGYPPSDAPKAESYSQDRARDDLRCVLDALKIDRAHVVGLSMGAFAALHFGFKYPERAHSLVIGGCGYGSERDKREQYVAEVEASARAFEASGPDAAKAYALGPTRVQFQNKDPRGWREFVGQFTDLSAQAIAHTLRGVQRTRPSLYDLTKKMNAIAAPTLVIVGDEDWPCLEPALLMKRAIPTAGLVVIPNSGHAINLEEPDAFNRHLAEFFRSVDAGRWPTRDPRATVSAILGMTNK